MLSLSPIFDPDLDLRVEHVISTPPNLVWRALTEADLVKQWFCPKPWQTIECDIDLRVGGKFFTLMQGPNGEQHPNTGCFLEIIPNQRLIWTSALQADFRPFKAISQNQDDNTTCDDLMMTCMIDLQQNQDGTLYQARSLHANIIDRNRHHDMGFHQGWGICAMQLNEVAKGLL